MYIADGCKHKELYSGGSEVVVCAAPPALRCLALTAQVAVSASLFAGLKASLQRLQLEYVDVVFANRPDNNTPMEGEWSWN